MGTEVAQAQDNGIAISAGVAKAFGAVESNIVSGEQTPHLSIKGKVWKIVIEGNEKLLMREDADGEESPMPMVKVLILNQVPKRSRVYFPDDYVEGTNVQPACWSINGDTPSSNVETPMAVSCAKCDFSNKGSKVTNDGKSTTACSTNKRICVIPSNNAKFTPLLLKLPVTSLWEQEGSEEAKGWFAYDAYLKYLKANGVAHTAMVETTMKFDSKDVSYPKVLFKYSGFISDEMAGKVAPRVDSEEVIHVLGLDEEPFDASTTSVAEATADAEEEDMVAEETSAVATVDDSDFGGEAEVEAAAPKKTVKKKTTKKKTKAKKPEAEVEVASSDDDLEEILGDWG